MGADNELYSHDEDDASNVDAEDIATNKTTTTGRAPGSASRLTRQPNGHHSRVAVKFKSAASHTTSLGGKLVVSSNPLGSAAAASKAASLDTVGHHVHHQHNYSHHHHHEPHHDHDHVHHQREASKLQVAPKSASLSYLLGAGGSQQHLPGCQLAGGQADHKHREGASKKMQSQSQVSLLNHTVSSSNLSSSSGQLPSLGDFAAAQQQQGATSLTIKRNVNLKYVKATIICLLAVDLLVSVVVHQFAVQDQLSVPPWLPFASSLKLRFSSLNLVLSSIWYLVLTAAILFDVYLVLVVSFALDLASLLVLAAYSILHFSRKIDFNTVNLVSLLGLLFGIIALHVYLALMACLTAYLMSAVKRRRQKSG